MLFEVKDRGLVGYQAPDGYKYCCTKDLVSKTKCHVDRLIYQASAALQEQAAAWCTVSNPASGSVLLGMCLFERTLS